MPLYLGGLLVSLGAMLGIFQMKRAMMPNFHALQERREPATITPGGGVRLNYSDEPGYFLIPGMPTRLLVSVKQASGEMVPALRFSYGNLVEKSVLIGPLKDEGTYEVSGEFYICAQPGVADCAKYTLAQEIHVSRDGAASETLWELNLPKLAQEGLARGAVIPDQSHSK